MTRKGCSRDDCPPANVKAEFTVKCFNCNCDIHLPCIGIALNASKILVPNIRFICDPCIDDDKTSKEQNDLNTSVGATPKPERPTIRNIMNEVSQLRSIIEDTHDKVKLIDDKTTIIAKSTDVLANRALRPPLQQPIGNNSPGVSTPFRNRPQKSGPSFADVIRSNQNESRSTQKRRNSADNGNASKVQKVDVPKPKTGTKPATSKLNVIKPIVKPTATAKPTFDRAIWVSRLNPLMEPSEIIDYIVSETPVTDPSKFNVQKLVKKGTDLGTLKFVSFKIEVNEDDYKILIEPDMWPEDVAMRPFVENKKFGDFLPGNNNRNAEAMQTNETHGHSVDPN